MSTEPGPPEGWTEGEHPPVLYRRFEFSAYAEARAFLDRLALLSKETGLYPDLSFGRTHVNVTVCGSEGAPFGAEERDFVARAGALASVDGA